MMTKRCITTKILTSFGVRWPSRSPPPASVPGSSKRIITARSSCTICRSCSEWKWFSKAGTCLSKVYANFYRLSEDLDFVFSMKIDASRPERRKTVGPAKERIDGLPERLPCFDEVESLRASNRSRQYGGRYSYHSIVTGQNEVIKVELSLREPLLDPIERRSANTMLLDPFRNVRVAEPISVGVMSIHETYAEKFRAALTRREPAIRDFYDIDYAIRLSPLEPTDTRLHDLVRQKLVVPGNDAVDVSTSKLTALRRQLESHLKPVLRAEDYDHFNLERAFAIVRKLAEAL